MLFFSFFFLNSQISTKGAGFLLLSHKRRLKFQHFGKFTECRNRCTVAPSYETGTGNSLESPLPVFRPSGRSKRCSVNKMEISGAGLVNVAQTQTCNPTTPEVSGGRVVTRTHQRQFLIRCNFHWCSLLFSSCCYIDSSSVPAHFR